MLVGGYADSLGTIALIITTFVVVVVVVIIIIIIIITVVVVVVVVFSFFLIVVIILIARTVKYGFKTLPIAIPHPPSMAVVPNCPLCVSSSDIPVASLAPYSIPSSSSPHAIRRFHFLGSL
jgi:hypothetical protein